MTRYALAAVLLLAACSRHEWPQTLRDKFIADCVSPLENVGMETGDATVVCTCVQVRIEKRVGYSEIKTGSDRARAAYSEALNDAADECLGGGDPEPMNGEAI